MEMSSSAKKITKSFMFLNSSFASPLQQPQLQESLQNIKPALKHPLMVGKLALSLTHRFHELLKISNNNKNAIEEYLLLKFIDILYECLCSLHKMGTNNPQIQTPIEQISHLYVVIQSAIVTYISPNTNNNIEKSKQVILSLLNLLNECVQNQMKMKGFSVQGIYPRLSGLLMGLIRDPSQINHVIFGKCLKILSGLLVAVLKKKQRNDLVSLENLRLQINKNENKENSFQKECTSRLQNCLQLLNSKIPFLPLSYYPSISQFVQKIWGSVKNDINLLCSVALMGHMVQQTCSSQLNIKQKVSQLSSFEQKLIRSQFTHYFLELLNNQNIKNLPLLIKLSPLISPNTNQSEQLLNILLSKTCLISNIQSNPHLAPIQNESIYQKVPSCPLLPLQKHHTFCSYPTPISSILKNMEFQIQKMLMMRMKYAEMSLQNIHKIKRMITNFNIQTKQILLESLLAKVSKQQDHYRVDMSLTKFSQFLTLTTLVYWLFSDSQKISNSLALGFFQTYSGCQALRLLDPTLYQQEILIAHSLMICYRSYNILTQSSSSPSTQAPSTKLQPLRLKLSLLTITLSNNLSPSFLIRSSCYYILLALSSPKSIGQLLSNLQSTLINNNLNNLQFILAVLNYCTFNQIQAEHLAQQFMDNYSIKMGSEQILRVLLPILTVNTIRKCMLSASHAHKWISLLKGNTLLLANKQIKTEEAGTEEKGDNFAMNDGPNVQIKNALGVVLLELGAKWQSVLHFQSRMKESAIELLLELAQVNEKMQGERSMVFFRTRFLTILDCLNQIMKDLQKNGKDSFSNSRISTKILKVLSKVPQQSYDLFYKMVKQNGKQIMESSLQIINKKHKQNRIQYLTNSNNKQIADNYDLTDKIINKMTYKNAQKV